MTTILLIGSTGQVGHSLKQKLVNLGHLKTPEKDFFSLEECPDSIYTKLDALQPEIIINAAAYTNVEKAEKEINRAYSINTEAPFILAKWANNNKALLCHYSTDYVFDGQKYQPYLETDIAHPLSVYGTTKWLADRAIQSTVKKHLILRISWVYSPRRHNFVKSIVIQLANNKKEIAVVNNEIGAPTCADWIAMATTKIIKKYLSEHDSFPFGTYHLSTKGATSRFQFAQKILKISNKITNNRFAKTIIIPASTFTLTSSVARPNNSQLDCYKLRNTFSLEQQTWPTGLKSTIKKILQNIQN